MSNLFEHCRAAGASAQPKSEKQGTETNDRFGSAGARRLGYSRRGGKRGAKGNSLASFCEMRLRESSPDPFDRCAERGCAVRRTAEVPVNAGERPSAARGGAFLPAAFGDAGRSTRNIFANRSVGNRFRRLRGFLYTPEPDALFPKRPSPVRIIFGRNPCTDQKNVLHLHTDSRSSGFAVETVDVAQSVRVTDCGSEGRGFESHLPPSKLLK